MTVFVESLISIQRDASGQVDDWRIGIVEWPYNELTPVKAILVQHAHNKDDPNDPIYIHILMDDGESTFTTVLSGNADVRRFASTDLSRRKRLILTRFPCINPPEGSTHLTGAAHYELEVHVAESTPEAIEMLSVAIA